MLLTRIRIQPKTELCADEDFELELYLEAVETDEFCHFSR